MGGRHPRIVEALDLFGDAGEVDGHRLAGDVDAHADRHGLADVYAVVVHERLGLVDAVGDRGGRRPRRAFGPVHDRGDRGLDLAAAVAVDQAEIAALAGLDRGDLGA